MDLIIMLISLCTAARGVQLRNLPLKPPWGLTKAQRSPSTLYDYEPKPATKGLWNPLKQNNIHSFSYPSPYQKNDNAYSRELYPKPAIKSDLMNSLGLYQNSATKDDFANSPSVYKNTQIISNEKKSLDLYPGVKDDLVKLLDLYPKPQTVDDLEKLICKLVKIHGNIIKYSMTNQLGAYLQHGMEDHVAYLHGLYSNSDVIDGKDHELCNFEKPDMKDNMAKLLAYYQACARKDAITNPLDVYQNSPVNGGLSNSGLYQNLNVINGMENSFGFYPNPEIMDNLANSLDANKNYGVANQFGVYSNKNNIKDHLTNSFVSYQNPDNKGFGLNAKNNIVNPQDSYQNFAIKEPTQNSVGLDKNTSFEEGTTNSYSSPQNLLVNTGIANSFGVNLVPVKTDNRGMTSSSTPYPNAKNYPENHEDEMQKEFGYDEEPEANAYKKFMNISPDFQQKVSANYDNIENSLVLNNDTNLNDDNMANSQDVYQNSSDFNDENVAKSFDVYQNSKINDGNMANPLDVYENPNIKPQNIANTPDFYHGIIDDNMFSSIDQNPNIKDYNMANLFSLNQNPKISYSSMANAFDMYQNTNFYDGSVINSFGMHRNPNMYEENMANSLNMYQNPNMFDGNMANSFGMYQNPNIYDGNTANSFAMYQNPNIYEGNIEHSLDLYQKPAINVGFTNTIGSQKPFHGGMPNSFGFQHKPDITGYEMEKLPGLYLQPDINNNMANSFDLYNNPAPNDKYYSPPSLNQNLYTNNGVENSFGFYKNPGLYQNPYIIDNNKSNLFGSYQKPALNTEVADMFGYQKPFNDGMSNSFAFNYKPDMVNLPDSYEQPYFNNNMADSLIFYKNPVINDKYYSLPLYQNPNLNSGIINSFDSYQNPGLYQISYTNNGIENPSNFYQNTGLYQNPHKNNGIANYLDFDQKPDLNQNPFINSNGIYRPNDISDSFGLYHKPSVNVNMANSLGFYNEPGINDGVADAPVFYHDINDKMAHSHSLYDKLPYKNSKEILLNSPKPASDDIEVSHGSPKNLALELADYFSFDRKPSTKQGMTNSHSFPKTALNMAQSFARIPYNDKMAVNKNSLNPTHLYGDVPSPDINAYVSNHYPLAGLAKDGYGSPDVNNLKVPMPGVVITKGRDVDFPSDEILEQNAPKSVEIKELPSFYASPNLGNQQSSIENKGTDVYIENDATSHADVTPPEPEEQMENSWWTDFINKAGFVLQNFKL